MPLTGMRIVSFAAVVFVLVMTISLGHEPAAKHAHAAHEVVGARRGWRYLDHGALPGRQVFAHAEIGEDDLFGAARGVAPIEDEAHRRASANANRRGIVAAVDDHGDGGRSVTGRGGCLCGSDLARAPRRNEEIPVDPAD